MDEDAEGYAKWHCGQLGHRCLMGLSAPREVPHTRCAERDCTQPMRTNRSCLRKDGDGEAYRCDRHWRDFCDRHGYWPQISRCANRVAVANLKLGVELRQLNHARDNEPVRLVVKVLKAVAVHMGIQSLRELKANNHYADPPQRSGEKLRAYMARLSTYAAWWDPPAREDDSSSRTIISLSDDESAASDDNESAASDDESSASDDDESAASDDDEFIVSDDNESSASDDSDRESVADTSSKSDNVAMVDPDEVILDSILSSGGGNPRPLKRHRGE
ncbi:MAG: hypothetical protein WC700_04050 [Gemmatimonadaceae bacterium]|jgi:hypothetical protein